METGHTGNTGNMHEGEKAEAVLRNGWNSGGETEALSV